MLSACPPDFPAICCCLLLSIRCCCPPPAWLAPQVVLGVLGCPNLPQQAIREGDCDEGQAGRSFAEEGVGTLFAAAKGQGARAGPLLAPGLPATPIHCNDSLPQEEVSAAVVPPGGREPLPHWHHRR